MKRSLITILFCFSLLSVFAQQYNNEWIDYNKTYYKFRLGGGAGLVRIPQPVLASVGLGTTPAEQFQLWRNGQQVPLYTNPPTGPLGTTGYIEFWGIPNDGKPDKELYIDTNYQHSDRTSLFSDTSAYFLTVNPSGNNLRFTALSNNVSGNSLPAEPYFIHNLRLNPRAFVNPGFGAVVGEYVYSSSFDKGEWWSTYEFGSTNVQGFQYDSLYVNTSGPAASFRVGVAGTTLAVRTVIAKINGTEVIRKQLDYFNDSIFSNYNVPLSVIGATNSALVQLTSESLNPGLDLTACSFWELNYPRNFNFGGSSNFTFELSGATAPKYLEIRNFNYGGIAPVLYDIQNNERFEGDISDPTRIRFAIPAAPSGTRKLILASYVASNIRTIPSLTTRNFVNFYNVANQGDYYIITNPRLYSSSSGVNPVDQFRQYRASATGGGYNVKVVDINELYDQFAFGISYHPASIRSFTRFCRNLLTIKPKFYFLIGKGVNYSDYRIYSRDTLPESYSIQFVPTFGYPASDNLLCTDPGEYYAKTPIGRLSVVSGDEILRYLDKVKQYEQVLTTSTQDIAGKAWMKNVVHCVGGGDPITSDLLRQYMQGFSQIISDTLYGGSVSTFIKSTASSVEQTTNQEINRLFSEGIGLLCYFGHSSANTFEFNLNDPDSYNNAGKYPVFIVNGCNSGNLFIYDPLRTVSNLSLSERYILANQKGSIAFFASTHWGLPYYLNIITRYLYNNVCTDDYGAPLGDVLLKSTSSMLAAAGPADFFARQHAEQSTLHGDPAVRLYAHPKPDYTIEAPQLRISPNFISVAETSFHVDAKFLNIGRAIKDSVNLEVKRVLPNGTTVLIIRKKVPGIRYSDSLSLNIPINPLTDKGLNKIIATVDPDGRVDEMSEINNSVTKDVFIFEDEARPVYPYAYSIISNPQQKLYFSTANPYSASRSYAVEIDTTELFNSPLKVTRTVTMNGGLAEINTGLAYRDSTVYYWRVAPSVTSGTQNWNYSSFIFIANGSEGFNQSHLYQYRRNDLTGLQVTQPNGFQYDSLQRILKIRTGLVSSFDWDRIDVWFDDEVQDVYTLGWDHWKIMAFNPISLNPIVNNRPNKFNSFYYPGFDNLKSFEYNLRGGDNIPYQGQSARRDMMNTLLDSIPDGYYVYITFMGWDGISSTFIDTWKADSSAPGFGPGRTLYHAFKQLGLNTIDTFTRALPCIFFFKKNDNSYPKLQMWGNDPTTYLQQQIPLWGRKEEGKMESVWFGPARQWKELHWRTKPYDQGVADSTFVELWAKDNSGNTSLVRSFYASNFDTALNGWINAAQYPYLKMVFKSNDFVDATPPQLTYWRLNGDFVPEGAVAPNLYSTGADTLEVGDTYKFGIAFKNISNKAFDSVKLKLVITDRNNNQVTVPLPKTRPIPPGDTVMFNYPINTTNLAGVNSIFMNFNPELDQPEQYLYNNFLYKGFTVAADKYKPVVDVTFDGIHILDRDIVSSTPHIQIKLNDNSKFLLLNDTSLFTLKIRSVDSGWIRNYYFANVDTVRFVPANPAANENAAKVDLFPALFRDGTYELMVMAKDRSNNPAGPLDFRVQFQIRNKPMISEVFNYPNPFTTSTAFVFTLTGREVPQQLKIEIMTVTGKIVREITRDELGPLRIGRNITEFKWDGTDMFGNKLANGVYLYRVVTNLNGKSLDKYTPEDADRDPSSYFKSGYGKMYLMR